MLNDELSGLMKATFETCMQLRLQKGGEYAGDTDALENFKRNGRDTGLDPIAVWRVYAGKHWDAISQYVMDINRGRDRIRSEPIEGRVDDLITYLCILKGLIVEKNRITADLQKSLKQQSDPSSGNQELVPHP